MTFRKLGNLGFALAIICFTSCVDSPKAEDSAELNELVQLEDQAFHEAVSAQEIKIEEYIKYIDSEIEGAEDKIKIQLEEQKKIAQEMLLQLRADFVELNEGTAAKWGGFEKNINSLLNTSIEEINYAQEMDQPNQDS